MPPTTSLSLSTSQSEAPLRRGQCRVDFSLSPTPLPLSETTLRSLQPHSLTSTSRQNLPLPLQVFPTMVMLPRTPRPRALRRSPSKSSLPAAKRTTSTPLRNPASRLGRANTAQEHHSCMPSTIFGVHLVLGLLVLRRLVSFCPFLSRACTAIR